MHNKSDSLPGWGETTGAPFPTAQQSEALAGALAPAPGDIASGDHPGRGVKHRPVADVERLGSAQAEPAAAQPRLSRKQVKPVDEPCSGGQQRPGRWPGAGPGAHRRSPRAPPPAGFPGRGGHGWVTGGRMRTRVLRWTRVGAVMALLAVTGLAAAASTGTAKADGAQPGPLWSGYVSFAGPFSSASADFIVPGATCS